MGRWNGPLPRGPRKIDSDSIPAFWTPRLRPWGELLEEKGVFTEEEWDQRIKKELRVLVHFHTLPTTTITITVRATIKTMGGIMSSSFIELPMYLRRTLSHLIL